MKIYVIEDEVFHLEDILISIETLGHQCVGNTDDSITAIQEIEAHQPDIVLVDIHLHGKEAGVTLARMIKSMFQLPVIFASSDRSSEIIGAATDVEPIAYLTKPIDEAALHAALLLAEKKRVPTSTLKTNKETNLFIKHGDKLVKVPVSTIVYAFSDTKNYCSLITEDGKKLTFRNSLSGFKKLLDPQQFIQIHRAHLVNLSFIGSYKESEQTLMLGTYTLPVGKSFKKELFKHMRII